jgi:hypothetical protein
MRPDGRATTRERKARAGGGGGGGGRPELTEGALSLESERTTRLPMVIERWLGEEEGEREGEGWE